MACVVCRIPCVLDVVCVSRHVQMNIAGYICVFCIQCLSLCTVYVVIVFYVCVTRRCGVWTCGRCVSVVGRDGLTTCGAVDVWCCGHLVDLTR